MNPLRVLLRSQKPRRNHDFRAVSEAGAVCVTRYDGGSFRAFRFETQVIFFSFPFSRDKLKAGRMGKVVATRYEGAGYDLTLTLAGVCLVVQQSGLLPDIVEADRVKKMVADACERYRIHRIVVDNRRTEAPPAQVRDHMRQWIHSGVYEAVGFVLNSDLHAALNN